MLGMRTIGLWASSLFALAGSVQALPAIMDRVPADAGVTIVVPNVKALEEDLQGVARAVGAPAGMLTLDRMLQAVPGVLEHVKRDGPVVFIARFEAAKAAKGDKGEKVNPDAPKAKPAEALPEPKFVALVPVEDYAKFVKALGGKGEGIETLGDDGPGGQPLVVKASGAGFAAISTDRAALEAFEGKPGAMAAHKAMVGAQADRVADASDLLVVVNLPVVRPFIEAGLKEGLEQMEGLMAMGGQELPADKIKAAIGSLLDQSRALTMGAKIDNAGISLDACVAFNEGSPMAAFANLPGKASNLTAKLPEMKYLLALSMDMSSPQIRELFGQMAAMQGAAMPGMDADAMKKQLEHLRGASFVLGFNEGGIFAGVLNRSVQYVWTEKPEAALAESRDMIKKLEETGMIKGEYKSAGAEVAGRKVDSWSMRFDAENAPPEMIQIMTIMFGPNGGPSGYSAAVDGGVVTAFSQSSEMMAAALNAAKGDKSLAASGPVALVAQRLPKDRIAEIYLSPNGLLDTAKGGLAMAGMVPKVDLPADLPPFALAIAPEAGGLQFTIHVPTPSLRATAQFVRAVREQAEGGPGPGREGAPERAPERKRPQM